jgi:hypothetical protein
LSGSQFKPLVLPGVTDYSENLFAKGFEADLEKQYAIVTSFENFEHFSSPLEEIKKINRLCSVYITIFYFHILVDLQNHIYSR